MGTPDSIPSFQNPGISEFSKLFGTSERGFYFGPGLGFNVCETRTGKVFLPTALPRIPGIFLHGGAVCIKSVAFDFIKKHFYLIFFLGNL